MDLRVGVFKRIEDGIIMATTGEVRTLREVVQGRRIIIPPIQRQYAWNVGDTATNPTSSQSTKLVEDLVDFCEQKENGQLDKYFLGNLIVVVEKDSQLDSLEVSWQLLDGQQRMTSLSLLMKAFDYQLDTINSNLARQLQADLDQTYLLLDQERFDDDLHPYPIKHRREDDMYQYRYFMNGRIDDVRRDTNMGRVAHSYRDFARGYTNANQIKKFLNIVLDHVLVSVTITDNLAMGFQMFQTANARGLPLTAYDMFRAFVVKKVESDFAGIPLMHRRNLLAVLDDLETIFQANSWGQNDKAKESNLKDFVSAYMSMRSGVNLRANTIINSIEREIRGIATPVELREYLTDMQEHAYKWRSDIHPGRPVPWNTYNFRFMRRMHRLGMKMHRGSYLSFSTNRRPIEHQWLLSVVEWAVLKQLLRRGELGGGTEIFSQLAEGMNTFWDPEIEITELHFTNFRTRWLVEKIPGEELAYLQHQYANEHSPYALLHRLEPIDGLASCDPGRNSQTTTIIRLANQERAGEGYDQIGNFYLTPGSSNNGLGHTQRMTHDDSEDLDERIETVLQYCTNVEHNMNAELLNLNENSNFEQFIAQRSARIYQSLNQKYLEFMQSEPPL